LHRLRLKNRLPAVTGVVAMHTTTLLLGFCPAFPIHLPEFGATYRRDCWPEIGAVTASCLYCRQFVMTTINEQMAAWGRKGGKSCSDKKREAARRNVAAARARIGKTSTHHPLAERCLPARPVVLVPTPPEAK
jgi:hypothetical protein